MQKALTYLQVELRAPSELQTPIAQCDINSTTPLSYRLRISELYSEGVRSYLGVSNFVE